MPSVGFWSRRGWSSNRRKASHSLWTGTWFRTGAHSSGGLPPNVWGANLVIFRVNKSNKDCEFRRRLHLLNLGLLLKDGQQSHASASNFALVWLYYMASGVATQFPFLTHIINLRCSSDKSSQGADQIITTSIPLLFNKFSNLHFCFIHRSWWRRFYSPKIRALGALSGRTFNPSLIPKSNTLTVACKFWAKRTCLEVEACTFKHEPLSPPATSSPATPPVNPIR